MSNCTFSEEEMANRWISALRAKAAEYEHEARKEGTAVTSPDIDDICNEMIAYFTAMIN